MDKSLNKGSFLTFFGRSILKLKWAILIAVLLGAAFSIPGLTRLDITVNIEDFFLEDDPILKNQQKFRSLFKNNDFIGVLVESDDVFSRESLELIKKVGDRLHSEVPLAKDVVSLVNIKNPFMGWANLKFRNGKLISSDWQIKNFKSNCNNTSTLKGALFSTDNRQAWVQLRLHPYPDRAEWDENRDPIFSVGNKAYDVVRSIKSGNIRLTATGVPVYAFRKEAEMMDDLAVVLAIGAVVALILSILIFHSVQGVAGTLLVIILSVISVFGIQGWIGVSIDSAFMSVPILLAMGVSIGYTVHISRFFTLGLQQSGDRRDSIVYALRKSARPILFTAFTTIVALLSFVFVDIKPIRWVGLTSAFCILAVYVLSMVLFPIVLSLGPGRVMSPGKKMSDLMETVLGIFGQWVNKYSAAIIMIFIAVSAVSFWGVLQLKVDFNAEKMTGTRLPHMKDHIHIGKSEIATSDTLDLVLVMPEKSLNKRVNLQRLQALEKKILKMPLVKKTSSLAGVIKDVNYFIHEQNDTFRKIPADPGMVNLFFYFLNQYKADYLYSWTTRDYSTTRVFVELSEFSSLEIENNIREIGQYIDEIFPSGTEYFFSGSTYQMAVMNQYITRGLVRSILIALVMITILMIIVFKSFKLGLVAMVPNIFPVLVAGGIMGFLKIPLEFVTMTVAPMIMGLAVDDTIHLLWHLKEDLKENNDYAGSVRRTFSVVGLAITETTVILCFTFLVFTVSKVNSIIYMGILSCAGILAAYLADIFVTPILIKILRYSKKQTPEQGEYREPALNT